MSTLDTRSVHAGEPTPRIEGAVTLPIFQTSTYTFGESDDDIRYIRYNNSPNHEALHEKLASITETENTVVTSSGMAAIASTLLSVLDAGEHLIAPRSLYGGTLDLFDQLLPRFDVTHSYLPEGDPNAWENAVRPETKVLYAESIANPRLEVPNLERMVAFADTHDLLAIIDNTFASPVNLRPGSMGFDLVLHSATKYLGGHSDLSAGVVAGADNLVDNVGETVKLLGGTLDPHACFLLHRSLKTIGTRVREHNRNAQAVAEALEPHRGVAEVRYPGLPTHSDYDRAQRLLDGFGGMVSFTLAASASLDDFFEALSLPIRAPSLGGVETLVSQPVRTSHKNMDPDVRKELGITKRFVRLSVGLEGADDLVEDLTSALDRSLKV